MSIALKSSWWLQSNEFQINTYTLNDQAEPAIAAWSDTGNFIVTWDSLAAAMR